MRDAFIKEIFNLARKDKDIILISADIGAIVFDEFRKKLSHQYINAGVSEANMIGIACGLAMNGKKVFVYTIIPFLVMRAFEFIRVNIAVQNLPVKIIGVGAGLSYSALGPTHHSIEDIALMRALPNMTVISPASPLETRQAVKAVCSYKKPVYLRLGLGKEKEVYQKTTPFKIGKAKILKEGGRGVIISAGSFVKYALKAAQILEKKGINLKVVNMHTIKPLDKKLIKELIQKYNYIFSYEEHSIIGGLGSALSEIIAEEGNKNIKFKMFGVPDAYCYSFGKKEDLYKRFGLTPEQIALKIKRDYENG